MVRSADSLQRARSIPPCTMPNKHCVRLAWAGTDAACPERSRRVRPEGRSPELSAASTDCELVPLPATPGAELRAAGPTNASVLIRAYGTSCLCSLKYFLLRAAHRPVISIDFRMRA